MKVDHGFRITDPLSVAIKMIGDKLVSTPFHHFGQSWAESPLLVEMYIKTQTLTLNCV